MPFPIFNISKKVTGGVVDPNLIAEYLFNGNANDTSGNGYDMTTNNATLTKDRGNNPNSAYFFERNKMNVTPVGGIGSLPLSISCWVENLNDIRVFAVALNKIGAGTSFAGLGVDTNLPNAEYLGTGGNKVLTGTTNVTQNGWTHIAAVFESASLRKLYVDGILENTDATTDTDTDGSIDGIQIGYVDYVADGQWFYGSIDDVRIYNKALTGSEITALANETISQLPADITTGLQASYPFTGNANDISGNNYHGVVTGATLTTGRKGDANDAYNFSGSGQFIDVPFSVVTSTPCTFSVWYKTTSSATTHRIVSIHGRNTADDFLSCFMNSGRVLAQSFDGGVAEAEDPASTNDGNWHHACAVYYSNAARAIYIDGVLKDYTYNLRTLTGIDYLAFGYLDWSSGNIQFFNGDMDDIKIYNRALTGNEVKALYNE